MPVRSEGGRAKPPKPKPKRQPPRPPRPPTTGPTSDAAIWTARHVVTPAWEVVRPSGGKKKRRPPPPPSVTRDREAPGGLTRGEPGPTYIPPPPYQGAPFRPTVTRKKLGKAALGAPISAEARKYLTTSMTPGERRKVLREHRPLSGHRGYDGIYYTSPPHPSGRRGLTAREALGQVQSGLQAVGLPGFAHPIRTWQEAGVKQAIGEDFYRKHGRWPTFEEAKELGLTNEAMVPWGAGPIKALEAGRAAAAVRLAEGVTDVERAAHAGYEAAHPIGGLDIRLSPQRIAANQRRIEKLTDQGLAANPEIVSPHPEAGGHQVVGPITPENWWKRTQHVFTNREEGLSAAYWYRQLGPMFERFFGEDTPAIMRGFGVSQANASPSSGLQAVLRVRDKLLNGEEIGPKEISTVAGSIKAAVKGDPVERGVAAKLSDFIDSLEGASTRRWAGRDISGGAPTAIDIHAARDLGYVDRRLLEYLRDRHGIVTAHIQADLLDAKLAGLRKLERPPAAQLKKMKLTGEQWDAAQANRISKLEDEVAEFKADHAEAIQRGRESGLVLDNPGGSPTGNRYEQGVRRYQEITDYLNKQKAWGKTDWTPAEVQALGWSAIQRFHGVVPEDAMAAIERNTYSLALDMVAGVTERMGLPLEAQHAVAREVADAILPKMIEEENGFLRDISYGPAGVGGDISASATVKAILTPEQVDRLLVRMDNVFHWARPSGTRAGVFVARGAGGRAALEVLSPEFSDDAKAALFYHRLREILPPQLKRIVGEFTPLTRDGRPGIRIVTSNGPVAQAKQLAWARKFEQAVQRAADDIGLEEEVVYHPTNVERKFSPQEARQGDVGAAVRGTAGAGERVGDPLAAEARSVFDAAVARIRAAAGPARSALSRLATEETGSVGLPGAFRGKASFAAEGSAAAPLDEGAIRKALEDVEADIEKLGRGPQSRRISRKLAGLRVREGFLRDQLAEAIAASKTPAPLSLHHAKLVENLEDAKAFYSEKKAAAAFKPPEHIAHEEHRIAADLLREAKRAEKIARSPVEEQIKQGLPGAKILRGKQEAGYTPVRKERLAAYHRAVEAAGGGYAGHLAGMEALRGELPKLHMRGWEHLSGEEEMNAAMRKIEEFQTDKGFDHVKAKEAIRKAIVHGKTPTNSEIKLLEKVFGKPDAAQVRAAAEAAVKEKDWLRHIGDVVQLPRAIQTTLDLSAVFRQGLVAFARHPIMGTRNIAPMLAAARSPERYLELMAEIYGRETFDLMEQSRLAFTDAEHFTAHEEAFVSDLAVKLTGGKKYSPVAASSRAYTLYLNRMRADMFDLLAMQAIDSARLGKTEKLLGIPIGKGGEARDEYEALKDLATYINSATGRGNLKHPEMGRYLNNILFAPRLLKSRFNFLANPAFYYRMDPFARKQAIRAALQTLAAGSAVMYAASLIPGVSIGEAKRWWDPRSANFGKIRFGNVRIDIWGGFQPIVRYFAQLATGVYISSTTGKAMPLTGDQFHTSRLDILTQFGRSKLAPTPGLIADVLAGDFTDPQKITGQRPGWGIEALQSMSPLLVQDIYDVYSQTHSIAAAAGMTPLGALGFSVQAYGPRKLRGGGPARGIQPVSVQPIPVQPVPVQPVPVQALP